MKGRYIWKDQQIRRSGPSASAKPRRDAPPLEVEPRSRVRCVASRLLRPSIEKARILSGPACDIDGVAGVPECVDEIARMLSDPARQWGDRTDEVNPHSVKIDSRIVLAMVTVSS